MELKDFIKGTISQIDEAVRELNDVESEKAKKEGYMKMVVNPYETKSPDMTKGVKAYRRKTRINFHINLVISEENKKDARIGVLASVVGLGMKGENNNASQSSTSIDFALDVLFHEGYEI